MTEVADILARFGAEMTGVHVQSLGAFLDDLPHYTPGSRSQARKILPTTRLRKLSDELWKAWSTQPELGGPALAMGLRTSRLATDAEQHAERVDLVATGPETWQVPVKRTADVLRGVIEEAADRLFIFSFAAYREPSLLASLSDAVGRGVTVTMVLGTKEHDDLHVDAMKAFSDIKDSVTFLTWSPERRPSVKGATGKMHAKAAIADGRLAFITSANLTGAGMDLNMELGVLVRGGPIPITLEKHYSELRAQGILIRQ